MGNQGKVILEINHYYYCYYYFNYFVEFHGKIAVGQLHIGDDVTISVFCSTLRLCGQKGPEIIQSVKQCKVMKKRYFPEAKVVRLIVASDKLCKSPQNILFAVM